MAKEEEYTDDGKIYKEEFEKEPTEEEEVPEVSVVKVAGRPIEVYFLTILNKLQTNDQFEIQCLDTYLDRALHIVEKLDAIGIRPENGNIVFEKRPEDIINRKTGKKFRQLVNRITLTKVPELFRFTHQ